jgi:hypothetical protein
MLCNFLKVAQGEGIRAKSGRALVPKPDWTVQDGAGCSQHQRLRRAAPASQRTCVRIDKRLRDWLYSLRQGCKSPLMLPQAEAPIHGAFPHRDAPVAARNRRHSPRECPSPCPFINFFAQVICFASYAQSALHTRRFVVYLQARGVPFRENSGAAQWEETGGSASIEIIALFSPSRRTGPPEPRGHYRAGGA